MGTFGSIESLITSLRAQSLAQMLVNHNIANAATPGYSRRIPLLVEVQPGALGGVGSGVRFGGVERIRDEFLDLQIRFERAHRGETDAQREAIAAMRIIFPELNAVPGAGLTTALTTFFGDWNALAAAPGSAALRQTLLTNASTLTAAFRDAHLSLRETQRLTDTRLRGSLERINDLLGRIATANAEIIRAGGPAAVAPGQLDDRDRALAELAGLVKIDTVQLGDGTVLVLTGNARTLVRGGKASELVALIDAHEPAFAAVGLRDTPGGSAANITGELRGGRVRGLLDARDGLIEDQLLELDELAHSLVTQVNLVHAAGYALDGVTTGTAFFTVSPGFTPSEALDITVNPAVVKNASLIAAARIYGAPADGDQAATLGALEGLVMNTAVLSSPRIDLVVQNIDPTRPMNSGAHTVLNGAVPFATNANSFFTPPTATGTIVINGVLIPWTDADSLDTIAGKINLAFGPSVRAGFDWTRQQFFLLSDSPLTVFDQIGNLTSVLNLQARVRSLAPVNQGIGPLDRPLLPFTPLNQIVDRTRTVAATGGTIEFRWQAPSGSVNVTPVAWNAGQDLVTIVGNINAALGGAGAPFTVGFSALSQEFTIQGTAPLPAGAALPIGPIEVRDATGNLSFVFNLESQPRFGQFRDALLAQMQAQLDGADAAFDAADGAVTQLELQQDAIAKVNVDEEKARLLEYLRAYEASIRAMAALDEALNTLINRMAASNFSGGSTQSVLTN